MRVLSLLTLCCLAGSLTAETPDWNQFRGPNGDGHIVGADLPVEFGSDKNVKWKVPVDGKAWSSPVVSGDTVWMTNAPEDGTHLDLLAFDARTGERTKTLRVFDNPDPDFCHPMNSYATPTPIVQGGVVYVHFGTYGTAAIDEKTGEPLWTRRDLRCDHFRGPASSPCLWRDRLFLLFDGYDVQYVVALDARTGKTVWRQNREIDYGTDNGDRKKAYATPAVVEVDGKPQLICPAAVATEARTPDTGELLWTVYHGGMNSSIRPLLDAETGLLVLSDGMGELLVVNPSGISGKMPNSNIIWRTKKAAAKKSSPLLHDGQLYMIDDNGIASCWELATGKNRWLHRIGGDYAASPVLVNDRIYFFSRDGDVPVIAVDPDEFRSLAENQFDEGFMASPAVHGDAFILRTTRHLYRIEK